MSSIRQTSISKNIIFYYPARPHTLTTATIVERILSTELPWGATVFIADNKGMILAMSPKVEKILALTELKAHVYNTAISKEQLKPEEFNLFKSNDLLINNIFTHFYATDTTIQTINQKVNLKFLFFRVRCPPQDGSSLF